MIMTAATKAYYKIIDVIYSCRTEEHLEGARKMINNFKNLFPQNHDDHTKLINNLHHKARFGLCLHIK